MSGPRNPHEHPISHRPNERGRDGQRLRPGLCTSRTVYRRLILRTLLRAEQHELRSREIRSTIARRFADRFTDEDRTLIRDREPRWANNLQWTRKRMVMDGLLESTLSAGHGVWKLTAGGVREAESLVG